MEGIQRTVSAFKSAISTGDMAFLWTNNGILLGFMVVFIAITFGYFALIFKKRHSKETVEALKKIPFYG